MPEEVFETPQPVQPTETKSFDWPKVILATVLGFSLLAVAAYAGYWYGTESAKVKSQIPETPTLTPTPTTTTPTAPTDGVDEMEDMGGWQVFNHSRYPNQPWDIKFSGFSLYYPVDWELEEVTNDPQTAQLKVKVSSANGDYLEISQGSVGGGRCIYPDEADYLTIKDEDLLMAQKLDSFEDIIKGRRVWRLTKSKSPTRYQTHLLCEKRSDDGKFSEITSIGFTMIKVTSRENETNIKDMLERIKLAD